MAVPKMRVPECARGGAGQSDRWRQYIQVRDVRQHLDDLARTINLVLNADAHRFYKAGDKSNRPKASSAWTTVAVGHRHPPHGSACYLRRSSVEFT